MKAWPGYDVRHCGARRLFPVLAIMMMVTLACQLSLGGPAVPTARPTTAAQSDWRSTLSNNQPGKEFSITISETELNDMLPGELKAGQNVTVTDPQIVLLEGEIQAYGQASNGMISARFRADLDVKVDEAGHPRLIVTAADFGSMPVPTSLLDDLTTALNDALLAQGGSTLDRLRVSTITILDGAMNVTGIIQ